jgi:hypothetical protein
MTLAELKKQVECQFEIPVQCQKWILDKSLANDDAVTLASYGIAAANQNIYLYLVTPGDQLLLFILLFLVIFCRNVFHWISWVRIPDRGRGFRLLKFNAVV